MELKFIEYILG